MPRLLRPSAVVAVIVTLAVLTAACAGEGDQPRGTWLMGPTLEPASAAPGGSAAPAGSAPVESAPVTSPAVGSAAPVGSIGPDTDSAPQPSGAP